MISWLSVVYVSSVFVHLLSKVSVIDFGTSLYHLDTSHQHTFGQSTR